MYKSNDIGIERGMGAMGELMGQLVELQQRFWAQLVVRANDQGVHYHARCRAFDQSFLSAGAGRTGLTFEYVIYERDATAIQLYFSHKDHQCNEDRFTALCRHREAIEEKLGARLSWNPPKPDAKCCSVQYRLMNGGLRDAGDHWPEIQNRMIDAMDRFATVVRPYFNTLPC